MSARTSDPPARLLWLALLRTRLDKFVQAFFEMLESKPLVCEQYVEALCFALQETLSGADRRLLVTMPPRHLKSLCAAVMLPAFALGRNPLLKIAVVTYGQELGGEHAGLFWRIVSSPLYRRLFPAAAIVRRRDRFQTAEGGYLRLVSVGGTFTGIGIDILIVDDLIKANEVGSDVKREAVENFFRNTAMTRFNDPGTGRVIAIQQRLHPHDFVSELIDGGHYRHLNWPSINDQDRSAPLYMERSWVWPAGAVLSPQRYPRAELDRLRDELTTPVFNTQYLLNPDLPQGAIVDWSRVNVLTEPWREASIRYVVLSVDTALSFEEDSDFTAVTAWAYRPRIRVLAGDGSELSVDEIEPPNSEDELLAMQVPEWSMLEARRFRVDYNLLKVAIVEFAESCGAERMLIERSALGFQLAHDMRERGFATRLETAQGEKAERLAVAMDSLYSGTIKLVQTAPGFDLFRRELIGFGSARHDDLVDTFSQLDGWQRHVWMPEIIAIDRGERPPRRPRRDW